MAHYVIDTSVFMKLFLEEEDSDKALEFFINANTSNATLLIPPLFQSEFLSVLRSQQIDFASAYGILEDYLQTNMVQVDYSRQLMSQALAIAAHGHSKSGYPSIYDSIYHALAIINNCDFITTDARHYKKTKSLGRVRLLGAPTSRSAG